MLHSPILSMLNSTYVVLSFSRTIYSGGLKFLQVIYENLHCDLAQGFFLFMISVNRYDLLW